MQLEWIFALVVFFLWIVNGLLRGSDDERRQERARPPQGERGNPARPARRQPSDIDRFLEEVRRRRETQDRRPAAPAPAKAPEAARPRPSQPPTVVRPQPVAQPARVRESERQAIAEVIPLVLPATAALRPLPAVNVTPTVPQTDPIQPFLDMLHKPEILWTAMMIREIFGPPACRRQNREGPMPIRSV
jgi:hypothetical protein